LVNFLWVSVSLEKKTRAAYFFKLNFVSGEL
jgi:hypothetical protein